MITAIVNAPKHEDHMLCACCGSGPLAGGEKFPVFYQGEDRVYCKECATMVMELGGTQNWAKGI